MPLRTAEQYKESLRDNRVVYFRGRRVDDVTTHPVIGLAVRHASIDYEIALEDPVVLTEPWKAAFPLQLDEAYRMFEYACHEDNSAIRNFIETSRFERRQNARATQ